MIRAIVIDDSAYNRVTISRLLEKQGDVRVVATAVNGEDGIKQVVKHKPDVITLDLEMPLLDGFAFLRWLMANIPTPVIVVSSRASDRSVFKALEFGAVDFIAKPGGRVSSKLEEIERDLIAKVRQCADVKLDNVRTRVIEEPKVEEPKPMVGGRAVDMIAIGSSTGGPPALQHLFQKLPLMRVPIVVAQHMPPTFTRLFAERVDRLTPYKVKEAENGEALVPGVVYIGPGGRQTEVVRNGEVLRIRLSEKASDDLYAPSVNRLFDSASDACADRLLVIVLTGMGDDGAQAIRKVAARGGKTLAESAETAIIFGMPAEAIRTGAVQRVLALHDIPDAMFEICTAS